MDSINIPIATPGADAAAQALNRVAASIGDMTLKATSSALSFNEIRQAVTSLVGDFAAFADRVAALSSEQSRLDANSARLGLNFSAAADAAGRFTDETEAETFRAELKHLLITQKAAFNSPVWFNIGVKGVPQQGSACFILAVNDSMSSILNWYTEEGVIFKGGSGAGVNLSKIRSSYEFLQGGGTASGPVSFMRGADASAGTIKSGGKTRRAAKMVILDVDHPDVEEFIWCKAREEQKARVLRDAGFDMDLDGKDITSIQYQNANNSVRVSDDFMQAVIDDADWALTARHGGGVVRNVKAREIWRDIAQAAWECADPGLQFDTTINKWHTSPNTARINGSNPCSEYMHIDNSACNLASINLMKYLRNDGHFDIDAFKATIDVLFTAQEIVVGAADYPTEMIGINSRKFRQLGLGYAYIGALLMASGLAYDSDEGRAWAAAITAVMASTWAAGSRTTPPLPTRALPTSNCGFTSSRASRRGACSSRPRAGSTSARLMNDTSATARSGQGSSGP